MDKPLFSHEITALMEKFSSMFVDIATPDEIAEMNNLLIDAEGAVRKISVLISKVKLRIELDEGQLHVARAIESERLRKRSAPPRRAARKPAKRPK